MEEFAKMDVFFVIASVAVIVLTILVIILLTYAIRLVRSLENFRQNALDLIGAIFRIKKGTTNARKKESS